MSRSQLKIGLLSPPWLAVPPPAYGGTESIVDRIARGLVAAGHHVTLYATGESTAPAPLAYSVATAAADRMGEGTVELRHVMEGYEALAGCDIVHDHTLVGPAWTLACGRSRVVTTCHGPFVGELSLDPALPARLRPMRLENLPLAGARIDITVRADSVDVNGLPAGVRLTGQNRLGGSRTAAGNGVRPLTGE
jgi:hypothetical protein